MYAACVTSHHLVCPIHASHNFIIVLNYLRLLRWFSLPVTFSVSTLFAVCKVEMSFTSHLSCHTFNRIGLFLSKRARLFFRYFSFIYFISGVDQSPGPQRSLDVMPLNIFLCGYVKCYVVRTSADDIGALCATIIEAIPCVVKRMLTRTWAELEYRFHVARTTRGLMLR